MSLNVSASVWGLPVAVHGHSIRRSEAIFQTDRSENGRRRRRGTDRRPARSAHGGCGTHFRRRSRQSINVDRYTNALHDRHGFSVSAALQRLISARFVARVSETASAEAPRPTRSTAITRLSPVPTTVRRARRVCASSLFPRSWCAGYGSVQARRVGWPADQTYQRSLYSFETRRRIKDMARQLPTQRDMAKQIRRCGESDEERITTRE